jgi:hypothetical protein
MPGHCKPAQSAKQSRDTELKIATRILFAAAICFFCHCEPAQSAKQSPDTELKIATRILFAAAILFCHRMYPSSYPTIQSQFAKSYFLCYNAQRHWGVVQW